MRKSQSKTRQPNSRKGKTAGGSRKAARKPVSASKKKPNQPAAKNKKPGTARRKAAPKPDQLDLSRLPPESVTHIERGICLSCVWEVFTRHLKLTPKTALSEMKRYTPSIEELNSSVVARPFVALGADQEPCPYCGASSKRIVRLPVYRIESGKATDVLRRELVKSIAKMKERFVVLEQKATQQHAFFEWLESISRQLDLDDPGWIREVSQHYLSRKLPKVDWRQEFGRVHSIRRSRRLEDGWETDTGRLFLAPILFDELMLVQYLVSRSHRAGGLTFEGRYTLPELFHRLRNSGYLRAVGVLAYNPADALEELVVHLSGGDAALRFYYIIDRRELLEGAQDLKAQKAKVAAR